MKIPIVISGAAGRMGTAVALAALSDPGVDIAGALETPHHPQLGTLLEQLVKHPLPRIRITSDPKLFLQRRCAWIDFSEPAATISHLRLLSTRGYPLVIGTTGFDKKQLLEIEKIAHKSAVLLSPNLSLGVNILYRLVGEAARILGDQYQTEIFEIHHGMKKDAPSGTALKLAEIISRVRGQDPESVIIRDRSRRKSSRKNDEIGISSARLADTVGEHTVFFGSDGERLEITHRAFSREALARGSIRAAKWIYRKKTGLYSFSDTLKK